MLTLIEIAAHNCLLVGLLVSQKKLYFNLDLQAEVCRSLYPRVLQPRNRKKNINQSEYLHLHLYLSIDGQTFSTIHDTFISITFNTFPVLWDISALILLAFLWRLTSILQSNHEADKLQCLTFL